MDELVSLDQLLPYFKQLEGYRHFGAKGWHVALCPCHPDKEPSLGLSTRGVLKCFRGCTFRDLMAFFRAAGLHDQEEEPVELAWEKTATYNYTTSDGEIVGVKERYEAATPTRRRKRFTWHSRKVEVREMPLYGWQTIGPGAQVYFVEGEKSADALHNLNLSAVTTAGGSSVTDIPEHVLEPLRGKEVVIWRDNDEPGRRYALDIARLLWPIAKSVRVVCWTDGSQGADAADYLALSLPIEKILEEKGVTPEQVAHDHIRATVITDYGPAAFDFEDMRAAGLEELLCELTVTLLAPSGIDTPFCCRINLLSMSAREGLVRNLKAQFGAKPSNGGWTEVVSKAWGAMTSLRKSTSRGVRIPVHEPAGDQWVIDRVLPANEDSILFGDEGTGKSLITTAIALSVATGLPFAGRYPVLQGGVIYVDYERTIESFSERIDRLARGMGIAPSSIPDLPIRYWPGDGVPWPDQIHLVKKEAKEIGAVLVIIDSIGFACGGDLFRPQAPLDYYRKKIGIATLSIGALTATEDGEERLYGSKYWRYAPHGLVWKLERGFRSPKKMDIKWENVKFSDGVEPYPLNLTFHFEPDSSILVQ